MSSNAGSQPNVAIPECDCTLSYSVTHFCLPILISQLDLSVVCYSCNSVTQCCSLPCALQFAQASRFAVDVCGHLHADHTAVLSEEILARGDTESTDMTDITHNAAKSTKDMRSSKDHDKNDKILIDPVEVC